MQHKAVVSRFLVGFLLKINTDHLAAEETVKMYRSGYTAITAGINNTAVRHTIVFTLVLSRRFMK